MNKTGWTAIILLVLIFLPLNAKSEEDFFVILPSGERIAYSQYHSNLVQNMKEKKKIKRPKKRKQQAKRPLSRQSQKVKKVQPAVVIDKERLPVSGIYTTYSVLVNKHAGQVKKRRTRINQYDQFIENAVRHFQLNPYLLKGLIAVESAGNNHAKSPVNAKGLTQIYSIPASCTRNVKDILGTGSLDLYNPEHNIWLGAATLHDYTGRMNGNIHFGLASYLYGPGHKRIRNSISFEQLPAKAKSYVRLVLAYSLCFKVIEEHGELLPYTENNREKIQSIAGQLPGF